MASSLWSPAITVQGKPSDAALTPCSVPILIITEVDGVANMETSPFRSQLPTGFATVMSAQVVISAGASSPQLRGDPKELKRFLHPEGHRYRVGVSDNHCPGAIELCHRAPPAQAFPRMMRESTLPFKVRIAHNICSRSSSGDSYLIRAPLWLIFSKVRRFA